MTIDRTDCSINIPQQHMYNSFLLQQLSSVEVTSLPSIPKYQLIKRRGLMVDTW